MLLSLIHSVGKKSQTGFLVSFYLEFCLQLQPHNLETLYGPISECEKEEDNQSLKCIDHIKHKDDNVVVVELQEARDTVHGPRNAHYKEKPYDDSKPLFVWLAHPGKHMEW